ncbi:hypothetical protein DIPPA_11537 [Diplonema papillatum]|nr:hypothetical protein DIPPA_11537 [Diplonema papillatum]
MDDSDVEAPEADPLSMTPTHMLLLGYGLFLAAFAVADYARGGWYELHILIDAAGSFGFPVTVLYFFYPRLALALALLTCAALLVYWIHHLLRKKRAKPVTALMLLLTMLVAMSDVDDVEFEMVLGYPTPLCPARPGAFLPWIHPFVGAGGPAPERRASPKARGRAAGGAADNRESWDLRTQVDGPLDGRRRRRPAGRANAEATANNALDGAADREGVRTRGASSPRNVEITGAGSRRDGVGPAGFRPGALAGVLPGKGREKTAACGRQADNTDAEPGNQAPAAAAGGGGGKGGTPHACEAQPLLPAACGRHAENAGAGRSRPDAEPGDQAPAASGASAAEGDGGTPHACSRARPLLTAAPRFRAYFAPNPRSTGARPGNRTPPRCGGGSPARAVHFNPALEPVFVRESAQLRARKRELAAAQRAEVGRHLAAWETLRGLSGEKDRVERREAAGRRAVAAEEKRERRPLRAALDKATTQLVLAFLKAGRAKLRRLCQRETGGRQAVFLAALDSSEGLERTSLRMRAFVSRQQLARAAMISIEHAARVSVTEEWRTELDVCRGQFLSAQASLKDLLAQKQVWLKRQAQQRLAAEKEQDKARKSVVEEEATTFTALKKESVQERDDISVMHRQREEQVMRERKRLAEMQREAVERLEGVENDGRAGISEERKQLLEGLALESVRSVENARRKTAERIENLRQAMLRRFEVERSEEEQAETGGRGLLCTREAQRRAALLNWHERVVKEYEKPFRVTCPTADPFLEWNSDDEDPADFASKTASWWTRSRGHLEPVDPDQQHKASAPVTPSNKHAPPPVPVYMVGGREAQVFPDAVISVRQSVYRSLSFTGKVTLKVQGKQGLQGTESVDLSAQNVEYTYQDTTTAFKLVPHKDDDLADSLKEACDLGLSSGEFGESSQSSPLDDPDADEVGDGQGRENTGDTDQEARDADDESDDMQGGGRRGHDDCFSAGSPATQQPGLYFMHGKERSGTGPETLKHEATRVCDHLPTWNWDESCLRAELDFGCHLNEALSRGDGNVLPLSQALQSLQFRCHERLHLAQPRTVRLLLTLELPYEEELGAGCSAVFSETERGLAKSDRRQPTADAASLSLSTPRTWFGRSKVRGVLRYEIPTSISVTPPLLVCPDDVLLYKPNRVYTEVFPGVKPAALHDDVSIGRVLKGAKLTFQFADGFNEGDALSFGNGVQMHSGVFSVGKVNVMKSQDPQHSPFITNTASQASHAYTIVAASAGFANAKAHSDADSGRPLEALSQLLRSLRFNTTSSHRPSRTILVQLSDHANSLVSNLRVCVKIAKKADPIFLDTRAPHPGTPANPSAIHRLNPAAKVELAAKMKPVLTPIFASVVLQSSDAHTDQAFGGELQVTFVAGSCDGEAFGVRETAALLLGDERKGGRRVYCVEEVVGRKQVTLLGVVRIEADAGKQAGGAGATGDSHSTVSSPHQGKAKAERRSAGTRKPFSSGAADACNQHTQRSKLTLALAKAYSAKHLQTFLHAVHYTCADSRKAHAHRQVRIRLTTEPNTAPTEHVQTVRILPPLVIFPESLLQQEFKEGHPPKRLFEPEAVSGAKPSHAAGTQTNVRAELHIFNSTHEPDEVMSDGRVTVEVLDDVVEEKLGLTAYSGCEFSLVPVANKIVIVNAYTDHQIGWYYTDPAASASHFTVFIAPRRGQPPLWARRHVMTVLRGLTYSLSTQDPSSLSKVIRVTIEHSGLSPQYPIPSVISQTLVEMKVTPVNDPTTIVLLSNEIIFSPNGEDSERGCIIAEAASVVDPDTTAMTGDGYLLAEVTYGGGLGWGDSFTLLTRDQQAAVYPLSPFRVDYEEAGGQLAIEGPGDARYTAAVTVKPEKSIIVRFRDGEDCPLEAAAYVLHCLSLTSVAVPMKSGTRGVLIRFNAGDGPTNDTRVKLTVKVSHPLASTPGITRNLTHCEGHPTGVTAKVAFGKPFVAAPAANLTVRVEISAGFVDGEDELSFAANPDFTRAPGGGGALVSTLLKAPVARLVTETAQCVEVAFYDAVAAADAKMTRAAASLFTCGKMQSVFKAFQYRSASSSPTCTTRSLTCTVRLHGECSVLRFWLAVVPVDDPTKITITRKSLPCVVNNLAVHPFAGLCLHDDDTPILHAPNAWLKVEASSLGPAVQLTIDTDPVPGAEVAEEAGWDPGVVVGVEARGGAGEKDGALLVNGACVGSVAKPAGKSVLHLVLDECPLLHLEQIIRRVALTASCPRRYTAIFRDWKSYERVM